ncbi:hypothetical protein J18TS1_01290 [Oceanobacillus oncorhynchi subsp. incaldanensis]|uniref:ATP-dependent Clp protease ATP-binding subunit ClpX n=2 Tax=Oceanobacillus TaxID=182709 RepID=A0A0A1MWY2_9BACI|nr:hypothetical protein J18TS1_01290 [Oceanobacillus oncorhynchi subsp. incaldanensis]CEI83917.1 ATP-dependent Clp protease ATP-binding subunit ClpX [Oceanobacillus oncorhynchi]
MLNLEAGMGQSNCSFCGKNEKEVQKLVAGPGVYICNECVRKVSEIVEEGGEK